MTACAAVRRHPWVAAVLIVAVVALIVLLHEQIAMLAVLVAIVMLLRFALLFIDWVFRL